MAQLKVYINNREINISNNSLEFSIGFYRKLSLYALRYSDVFYTSKLICTSEDLLTILDVKEKIKQAFYENKPFVKF